MGDLEAQRTKEGREWYGRETYEWWWGLDPWTNEKGTPQDQWWARGRDGGWYPYGKNRVHDGKNYLPGERVEHEEQDPDEWPVGVVWTKADLWDWPRWQLVEELKWWGLSTRGRKSDLATGFRA